MLDGIRRVLGRRDLDLRPLAAPGPFVLKLVMPRKACQMDCAVLSSQRDIPRIPAVVKGDTWHSPRTTTPLGLSRPTMAVALISASTSRQSRARRFNIDGGPVSEIVERGPHRSSVDR